MTSNCRRRQRCVDDAIRHAQLVCDDNNSRFTTLRKRVLKLIWANYEPVKAYDLLSELQKEDKSAKPSTVYRTLDFLLELGLVHKIHRQNSFVGCINPREKQPSVFLVCNNCNEVSERNDKEYFNLINNITKKYQFKPSGSSFEIEGLCSKCI